MDDLTTILGILAVVVLLFVLDGATEGTYSTMARYLWKDAIVALVLIWLVWQLLGI